MSRIGRRPIPIPAGVEVSLDWPVITVTGPKGTLTRSLPAAMSVETVEGTLVVSRPSEAKRHKQLHGLTRTLVANMVDGVTTGYRKTLEIAGVGYRAQKIGDKLQLNLGYSHPGGDRAPGGHLLRGGDPGQAGRRRYRQGARRAGRGEGPRQPGSRSPTRARASGTPAR